MFKYLSRKDFRRRVKILHYDDYGFEVIDIQPCLLAGDFFKSRFEELQMFCRNNPQYHIISVVGLIYINQPIPKAEAFYLGKGDPDPDLVSILQTSLSSYIRNSIAKFNREESLGELDAARGILKAHLLANRFK